MEKSLVVAASAVGLGVLAYCIYFDRKRHADPNFKAKLIEKRRKARSAMKKVPIKFPDLRNTEAMQRFFLQEVQLGEELLSTGSIDEGLEHISYAVAVCNQPTQLLGVLRQSLPPTAFSLLTQKLPAARQMVALSQMQDQLGLSGLTLGSSPSADSAPRLAVSDSSSEKAPTRVVDDDLE